LTLGGATVEQTRAALVGKIGENMSIRRFVRLQAKGKLATYVHGGSKIGVMVDVMGGDEALAKDLRCMSPRASRYRCRRSRCRRSDRERACGCRAESSRIRQARQHRREDG